jgi:hypothetical protein
MTPDLLTVTARSPGPKRRVPWWWLASSLVVVVIIATLPRLVASTPVVREITLVNRTPYAMQVQATDAGRGGWTGLGTVQRQRTALVRDVVDQGREWIFHFESQGFDGGELHVRKSDLERSGWTVVIAESVGARLERQGATPTPPPGY